MAEVEKELQLVQEKQTKENSRQKAVKESDKTNRESKKEIDKPPQQVMLPFIPRTVGEFFFADDQGQMPP